MSTSMQDLSFDTPDIGTLLDAQSPEFLHSLPFGVIRLNAAGVVDFYSDTESRQSGCPAPTAIGRDFYGVVAPCMANVAFRTLLGRAQETAVDTMLGHTGDYADRTRFLRIRITSAAGGGIWQLHERS